MEFIQLLKAIILGLVEGLTEFAPVSSTGHMIIVDDLWLKSEQFLTEPVANTFKVVIQLGSILAVVIIFKDRFIDLLGMGKHIKVHRRPHLKLTHILVGLLPAVVLGLLFEDYIDKHLFSTSTVLIGLVVGAFLMIAADLYSANYQHKRTLDQITHKQALIIGLIQCFSLWPGFSRSGSTISGGVLLGLNYRAAADFTFIMAVPIMAGASILSLLSNWKYFTLDVLPFFTVGFISAFLFAYVCIRFFLKIIGKVKLMPFAIYRIVLALAVYVIYF